MSRFTQERVSVLMITTNVNQHARKDNCIVCIKRMMFIEG